MGVSERNEHKRAVRQAFNRAADSYDDAAAIQREICHALATLLDRHPPTRPVASILDAGCGTGYGLGLLAQRFPEARRVALDFAPAMLRRIPAAQPPESPHLPVCADLEALPLAPESMDAVWSSLTLQWCDPARALSEFARVLHPGAPAWLATLGPDTLWELREAFSAIDSAQHVIRFHDTSHWRQAASDAGFSVLEASTRPMYAVAPELRQLLRDIKAIGAHSVGPERRRQPLGRGAWRTLEARYEQHRRPDQLLPATYDVIFLALRKNGTQA
ncbi:MAG: malonyl-ACP O-methyltransferase BioC [Rhodocyclales bacterium]|nr:malonyl-ACP O-methyltransferase BioC [Rhodocyclales bacterium]